VVWQDSACSLLEARIACS